MCSSLTVRNLNSTIISGSDKGVGLDINVCSIWNRSPGVWKPSDKHPLDEEIFLNKNREQRTKHRYDDAMHS